MAESWAIYERLLDEIPAEAIVHRCLVGRAWTLVESAGVGIAMTPHDCPEPSLPRPLAGRPLREVAAHVRSWNACDAAIGLAALDAHHNARAVVEAGLGRRLRIPNDEKSFSAMGAEIAGKKVAVIGHFPGIERLARSCALSVLERSPVTGDLPDFAAEYILPEQDYVFITGATLANKTLPRLLQLCAGAQTVLVGPSVPLTPMWFDFGVKVLAGSVVIEPEGVFRATAEGGMREIWQGGAAVTVQLRPEDFVEAGRWNRAQQPGPRPQVR